MVERIREDYSIWTRAPVGVAGRVALRVARSSTGPAAHSLVARDPGTGGGPRQGT
jgi:hypothetical protein